MHHAAPHGCFAINLHEAFKARAHHAEGRPLRATNRGCARRERGRSQQDGGKRLTLFREEGNAVDQDRGSAQTGSMGIELAEHFFLSGQRYAKEWPSRTKASKCKKKALYSGELCLVCQVHFRGGGMLVTTEHRQLHLRPEFPASARWYHQ